MVIFHSYVSLPEGKSRISFGSIPTAPRCFPLSPGDSKAGHQRGDWPGPERKFQDLDAAKRWYPSESKVAGKSDP
jgi:hypothetical protein